MSMTLSMTAYEWLGVLGAALVALLTFIFWMGWLFLRQIEKWLDARFAAMETVRSHASEQWRSSFMTLESRATETERRLMQLLVDLPEQFERRDDAIRREVSILNRLDAVGEKVMKLLECDIRHCPIKEQSHG